MRDQGFTAAQSLPNEIGYCYRAEALIQLLEERNGCGVCAGGAGGRGTEALLTPAHKSLLLCPAGQPVLLCPRDVLSTWSSARGRGCNSSRASSRVQQEWFLGTSGQLCSQITAGTGWGLAGQWPRGVGKSPNLPNLPQVLDLIHRLERGRNFPHVALAGTTEIFAFLCITEWKTSGHVNDCDCRA